MTSTATDSTVASGHRLPEVVDWLVGFAIAIGGFVSLVVGSVLVFVADRQFLVENVDRDADSVEIISTRITEPELLEIGIAVVDWTGVGLLVTGLAMVLFAGWFVVACHRSHARAREGTPTSSFGAFAVIGAVSTVLLSALPFSPVFGGAVAGYLERAESTRTASVGALAGALYLVPVAVVLLFLSGGLWAGFRTIGETGLALVIGGMLLVLFAIGASLSVGLSALGGYIGGWLADR